MALEIVKEKKAEPFICDRYLYLNADKTQILEEGDPNCRFVFSGPGSTIGLDDVEKYGLRQDADGRVVYGDTGEVEEGEPEEPKQAKDEPKEDPKEEAKEPKSEPKPKAKKTEPKEEAK